MTEAYKDVGWRERVREIVREREKEREINRSCCVMIYSYLMVITKSYVKFGVEKKTHHGLVGANLH